MKEKRILSPLTLAWNAAASVMQPFLTKLLYKIVELVRMHVDIYQM